MSSEGITSYPLVWPPGWRRASSRRRASFGKVRDTSAGVYARLRELNMLEAVARVLHELHLMGVERDDVVVSTNVELRVDGWPRSDRRPPADPGASVYWQAGKAQRCIAVDCYDRVADNVAAIAAALEAMRAIERHGGAEILDRAFTGFTALPSPAQWWHVLGFSTTEGVTLVDVDREYGTRARQLHPDKGGDSASMANLNWARDAAYEFLRGARR